MSAKAKLRTFGRALPPVEFLSSAPDWQQARVGWIEAALQRARSLPDTGWVVVDASREVGTTPRRYRLDGTDYAVWRSPAGPRVAPDACPHMGASLSPGRVCEGELVCPWHGLRLGNAAHGSWRPLPVYDDGVLLWAALTTAHRDVGPVLPQRPERYLDAVMRKEARCDPEDVIANRLDPWHGVHFHPYSFARLKVVEQEEESIVVRVVYRVVGPYGVEVDARFHCPERNTIAMTILRGEGEGSVVETHATRIESGRAAIIEATLATSDRPQFWHFVRPLSWLLRPLVRKAADRLWRDDAAYAERRYALRSGSRASISRSTSSSVL
ncbi:MAG: Rieske (2Fe-2S) protein [Candidatus Latescibacterota bacterium]|nr:MAG: Rieske (2Fe-2S) protein [Candidatus Latescibacterota bacterium]